LPLPVSAEANVTNINYRCFVACDLETTLSAFWRTWIWKRYKLQTNGKVYRDQWGKNFWESDLGSCCGVSWCV